MIPRPSPTSGVRATLEAKAQQVEVRPAAFDPHRPLRLADAFPPAPVSGPGSPARRRYRLALGAAVVVAAVVAAAALVLRSDPANYEPSSPSESTGDAVQPQPPPPVADGVLAPTAVPDDLTLWSVIWRSAPAEVPADGGVEQLFGTADGAVLVLIRSGEGPLVGESPTAVRGTTADLMPAKEFPDTASTLSWSEAGTTIDATFRGIGVAEAMAFLDGLAWRSADPQAGFAPPEGARSELLDETIGTPPGTQVDTGRFVYLDPARNLAPGAGRQLDVRTTTATGTPATTSAYLHTRFHSGEPAAGGMIESYDPTYGTLRHAWPDGRNMWIDANGSGVDEAELAAVADSITASTAAELTALRDGVRDRVGAQELVASADVGSGRLELRGTGVTAALCLVPPEADRICPADPGFDGDGTSLAQGFLVDGTWHVVAASTAGAPVISAPPIEEPKPLPGAKAAASGPWQFAVLAVPDDLAEVIVNGGNIQRIHAEG